MAERKGSQLTIIRDIPKLPTDVRFAMVASPLFESPLIAAIEASKFEEEHEPGELHIENIVTLEDSKGNVIGGAIIWEAAWEKNKGKEELGMAAAIDLIRQTFGRKQADNPRAFVN